MVHGTGMRLTKSFSLLLLLRSIPDFRKKQIRCLFLVAAAIGFGVQVMHVSLQYFGYRTIIQVHVSVPTLAFHHNIALCIDYADLLDRRKLPARSNETAAADQRLTVKQVFDATPRVDNAIDSCFYRISNWRYKVMEGRECHDYFNVSKYLTQEYICYRFVPSFHSQITLRSVTKSLQFQFMMNTVSLKKSFNKTVNVNTISFRGSYPFISRDFSVTTYLLESYLTRKKLFNYFDIFSNDYDVIHLEPPYDTMCVPRDIEEIFECKYRCLVRENSRTGTIAPNDIITDPLDLRIIRGSELNDDELLANVSHLDEKCRNQCIFHPCFRSYTKTVVQPRLITHISLGYYARTQIEPSIISESVPVNTFVEFFSFLCGCFGIWFGISFLSLNPFTREAAVRVKPSSQPFIVNIINPNVKVARILRGH